MWKGEYDAILARVGEALTDKVTCEKDFIEHPTDGTVCARPRGENALTCLRKSMKAKVADEN